MTYRPYNTLKATGIELQRINGSGSFIDKAVPVKIRTDGNADFVNVSVEADVFAIGGVTSSSASPGASISVVTTGRIENITTAFAFGDPVYLSKTGFLTNVKPSLGAGGFVAGDFIVRIGTIAKNETTPTQKDIVLEMNLVGQLES